LRHLRSLHSDGSWEIVDLMSSQMLSVCSNPWWRFEKGDCGRYVCF